MPRLLPALRRRISEVIARKDVGLKNAANVIREWLRGTDLLPSSTSALPRGKEYSVSVWLYRCVSIWQSVSRVPFRLVKDGADGKSVNVTTGPVAFLLKSPNSRQSMRQIVDATAGHMALFGNAFILREDGTNYTGVPQFLRLMNPAQFSIADNDRDEFGLPTRWTVTDKHGRTYTLDPRGVIHIAMPNPYDPCLGLSPVSALRASLDADYAARQHNAHMMATHGRIGGMVTFDDPNMTESQVKDMAKLWRENYEGPQNAGRTAFLTQARYNAINQSMKDLDWLEGQRLSREEIFAGFGIPPIVAGDMRYGTYENYDKAAREVWVTTLMPLGERIRDALQQAIVEPNQRGVMLQLPYDEFVPALREDKSAKITQYTQLIREGFVSPETAAQMVNLDIGETSEIHKTIFTTFNLVPAMDVLEGDTVYTKEDNAAPAPAADAGIKSADEPEPDAPDHRERLRTIKWRSLMNERIPFESQYAAALKKYFWKQRVAMLKGLDDYAVKARSAPPATHRAWTAVDAVAAIMGSIEDWNKQLLSTTDAVTEAAIAASAKGILQDLGKSPTDYKRLALQGYRSSRPIIMAKVNETTRDRLDAAARTIENAIREGTTIDEAVERMGNAIRGEIAASEARRRVIARTEIGRAMEAGRDEQMRDAGVSQKEWLSSRDSEVRDSHMHVDGQVVGIDDSFANGLQYPCDPNGPPEETINCRCTSLPVLSD